MRIECEACGHLGEASLRPTPSGGIEVVCAACGHAAVLGVAAAAQPPAPAPAPPDPTPSPPTPTPAPTLAAADPDALVAKLLPRAPAADAGAGAGAADAPATPAKAPARVAIDRGDGDVRCPKCGYRQREATACHRCGLALDRGDGHARPWESADPAKAPLMAELERRWQALLDGDFMDDAAHQDLIAYAATADLLEDAARRYRFFAQDHPDDPRADRASQALARIVELLHARFLAAQGGSTGSDVFVQQARKVKSAFFVVAVLMCLGVMALAMFIFGPLR